MKCLSETFSIVSVLNKIFYTCCAFLIAIVLSRFVAAELNVPLWISR
jgi:hypothetical protein